MNRLGEVGELRGDACEACGVGLVAGSYSGGCGDCDALLCPGCAMLHPAGSCGGRFLEMAA